MPSEERSCENCKHRASWTVDEDGTVWGADAECEGCIRFQCYPDKWEPKEKPTEGQRVCPKCGGEMGAATDYEGRTVYRCAPCHIWYHPDEGEWTEIVVLERLYPPPGGHEEKVR